MTIEQQRDIEDAVDRAYTPHYADELKRVLFDLNYKYKPYISIDTQVVYENEVWKVVATKLDSNFRVITRGDEEETVHIKYLRRIEDEYRC